MPSVQCNIAWYVSRTTTHAHDMPRFNITVHDGLSGHFQNEACTFCFEKRGVFASNGLLPSPDGLLQNGNLVGNASKMYRQLRPSTVCLATLRGLARSARGRSSQGHRAAAYEGGREDSEAVGLSRADARGRLLQRAGTRFLPPLGLPDSWLRRERHWRHYCRAAPFSLERLASREIPHAQALPPLSDDAEIDGPPSRWWLASLVRD